MEQKPSKTKDNLKVVNPSIPSMNSQNKYVALKGDQIVMEGNNAQELAERIIQEGVESPIIIKSVNTDEDDKEELKTILRDFIPNSRKIDLHHT